MSKWGRPSACGSCGDCTKCKRAAYMRRWYRGLTPEQRRAKRASRTSKETRRAADRHRADPQYAMKRRAHRILWSAITRGEVQRHGCEVCGREAQGHHEDYSKPLDVRWLCPEHHAAEHMEMV